MPIARQRGICQTSNAFNIARFISNVFLDAAHRHRQRCFSSRTALYAAAEYALKGESAQQVGQVRHVSNENNASAVPFKPIEAKAARRTIAKQQSLEAKLQASLDPTSLEKTLEKHRAVNMGALIKHVPVDKNVGDFKRPTLVARRIRRRKPITALSEKNNAHKDGLEIRFEEHELLRDSWFEHLDVSTVPKALSKVANHKDGKADKIIESKVYRKRTGFVLEYEGKYVNPISNAKLDDTQLPWAVAVNEAATVSERYDQTRFMCFT
jgi:hypothetical protein